MIFTLVRCDRCATVYARNADPDAHEGPFTCGSARAPDHLFGSGSSIGRCGGDLVRMTIYAGALTMTLKEAE